MKHKKAAAFLLICLIIAVVSLWPRFTQRPSVTSQMFVENEDGSLREIEPITRVQVLDFQISLEDALEDLEWVDTAIVAALGEGTSVYQLVLYGENISDKYDEEELLSCLEQQLDGFSMKDSASYEDSMIIDITLK